MDHKREDRTPPLAMVMGVVDNSNSHGDCNDPLSIYGFLIVPFVRRGGSVGACGFERRGC